MPLRARLASQLADGGAAPSWEGFVKGGAEGRSDRLPLQAISAAVEHALASMPPWGGSGMKKAPAAPFSNCRHPALRAKAEGGMP